jgi:hypothetical protein
VIVPLLTLAAILIGLPTVAFGRDDNRSFSARFIGFNEVPSINTQATATLRLTLTSDQMTFTLNYRNLTGPPAASHIHFGQERTNGAVVVFFCGGGGQAACPATTSGTITGTITAANVQEVAAQGIAAGDLAAVMRAIRGGAAYANIHTARFPSGETRGQIHRSDGGRDDQTDQTDQTN